MIYFVYYIDNHGNIFFSNASKDYEKIKDIFVKYYKHYIDNCISTYEDITEDKLKDLEESGKEIRIKTMFLE